jgi:hypothetical protein
MMVNPKTYIIRKSRKYLEVLNLSEENHGRLDEAYAKPHDIALPGAIQVKFKELHDDHVNNV